MWGQERNKGEEEDVGKILKTSRPPYGVSLLQRDLQAEERHDLIYAWERCLATLQQVDCLEFVMVIGEMC